MSVKNILVFAIPFFIFGCVPIETSEKVSHVPNTINTKKEVVPEKVASPQKSVAETAAPTPSFPDVKVPEGVWYDRETGLMWQMCPYGMTYQNSQCSGYTTRVTRQEAIKIAFKNRSFGFSDWRVPTISDLKKFKKNVVIIKEVHDEHFYDPKVKRTAVFLKYQSKEADFLSNLFASDNYVRYGRSEETLACFPYLSGTGPCGNANLIKDGDGVFASVSSGFEHNFMLVRDGIPNEIWNKLLSDSGIMAQVQAATAEKDRLLSALVPTGGVGDKWGLLNHLPNALTTTPAIDDGTLNAIDWYISGLRQAEKARKTIRTDFLGYLNSRRVYDYDNHFTSPFDQEDFTRQLAAEKKGFVDRIFDYSAAALPSKIYSFTPIKLDSYDFATEELKFSTCRDLGLYNNGGANGMRCGGSGVVMPDDTLADNVQKLGALGDLATAGKVRLVKFASFFSGDNNGAPLYILGRGMPGELRLKLPKDQVRMLYDLAKQTRVRKEYESELGGKMLSAKVLYDAPQAKGFNASNAVHKDWFVTFTGGAAVSFEIRALAVCFFDGEGKTPLFCRALDQPLAAVSSKNK